MIRTTVAIFLVVLVASLAHAGDGLDVPLLLKADQYRACGASGVVVGLDPQGDGFLSVRSGPGGRPFREIDRLFNGDSVWICDEHAPWYGVVYNHGDDCRLPGSWPVTQPYTGPCLHGWVHRKYIHITGG